MKLAGKYISNTLYRKRDGFIKKRKKKKSERN